MKITDKENAYLKVAWENDRPIPATTKGKQSSWNFIPNEERVRTLKLNPIMISGALNGYAMQDYLKAKRDEHRREVLAKANAFIKQQRAKHKLTD